MHHDPSQPFPHVLVASPITADAFAPYGVLLQAPEGTGKVINAGHAQRFDLVDDLQLSEAGGRAQMALFRTSPRAFPLPLVEMERHALGSQSFLPWGRERQRFVVVVAPAGPAPAAHQLQAFVTEGCQGVTLHRGTWHHALIAVDGGDFIVVERAADTVDCDLARLDAPVLLQMA